MSAEITTIIVPSLAAAVSAPPGVWVGTAGHCEGNAGLNLTNCALKMKQKLMNVENSEPENVRKANDILMENAVKPPEKGIKSLCRDADKFRKAIGKIPSCPMAGDCPVFRELPAAEADK